MFWMAGQNRSVYEETQAKKQQIQQQADLEDEAAKHRGLSVDTVNVRNYRYKLTPNVPPNIDVTGLKLTRIAKVTDADGECVGTIENGKLLFRKYFVGVCSDDAIQKRYEKAIGA